MTTPAPRVVLQAVQRHPLLMSPLLLEYLLRGEMIGRMQEKGLLPDAIHTPDRVSVGVALVLRSFPDAA